MAELERPEGSLRRFALFESRMSPARDHYEISSTVPADVDAVWAHCSTMTGVSRELWPWLRMTYPDGAESLVPATFVPGKPLFRSTLLLCGLLPVDRTDLTIVELEPGRRFFERSAMASQRVWEHERLLEPIVEGTRITDRLRWRGRFSGATTAFALAVPPLFRWRHYRLQQIFTGMGNRSGGLDTD